MALKLLFAVVCFQASLTFIQVDGAAVSRFYGTYDAIPYEVINKTKDFEVRRYPSFRYAEARETGVGMSTAGSRNFRKLFSYISGNNEEKQKIPMTVPVILPLQKAPSGAYAEDFSMMFWLPKKYQSSPPEPSKAEKLKDQVLITTWGERIAYVRTYGWWAFESLVRYNENKLRQSLEENGIRGGVDYDPSMVYSASYNSPWQIFGRQNDVMFMQMQHANADAKEQ